MTLSFYVANVTKRPARTLLAIAVAALVTAQGPRGASADPSAADLLFQEGKTLMAQRRYAEACPKLAESQRLDPSGGTILHLALCHKEEGRIATAYKELQDAILFAQRDKRDDREKAAKALASELSSKLPTLTITVRREAAAIPGLSVKRDGALVPPSAFGAPAAVDPGQHTVTAWAPGRAPFLTTVDLRGDGATYEVVIPDLEADPTGDRSAAAGAEDRGPGANSSVSSQNTGGMGAQRKAGAILGGVGVISLGVGAVFGIQAAASKPASAPHCDGNFCDDEGIRIREKGLTQASIATGTLVAGGALAALGLVLFITGSPSSKAPSPGASVGLSLGPSGAFVRGSF